MILDPRSTKNVLALDPGSRKVGVVLARRAEGARLEILWRRIVPPEGVVELVEESRAKDEFDVLVVGAGTHSSELVPRLREAAEGRAVLSVDERNTTVEARARYWRHHGKKGWRRLLPSTMLVPPEPVDDFAALVLAERFLLE
ncbi:MAG: hypothetical protein MH204_00205 [Fimbriimonadaceae bacterium]|nr:hypothetical protein [Fimbriimonadaceae bacterium]